MHLAEAVLNVKDLTGQTAFITQIIGLDFVSNEDRSDFGTWLKSLGSPSCDRKAGE